MYHLGKFFVNGDCVCSPFVTKSGRAENPATFGPCVKSMAADFISQNAQCSLGGLSYKFRQTKLCYFGNLL